MAHPPIQKALVCVLLGLLPIASASGSGGDVMEGFDDFSVEESESAQRTDDLVDLGGELALLASYSYTLDSAAQPTLSLYDGFSRLQTLLRLHADVRKGGWQLRAEGKTFRDWAYDREGRHNFDARVIDDLAGESEWEEAYVRREFGSRLEIKSGRQLLVWGRSDNLRALDLINPLDLREPGSTDIEAIRLPLAMTRVHYLNGSWTVEGVAVHEVRFHKLPPPGSEFNPSAAPRLPEERPPGGWAAEHAFSITGVFPGWDFSLHAARLWDDQPWLDASSPLSPILRHDRIRVAGFSFNRVLGPWLAKGEYASLGGLHYAVSPRETWRRSDALVGVEYAGFADTQVALEASVSHVHGWSRRLDVPGGAGRDVSLAALRLTRSMAHDRVHLTLVSIRTGSWLHESPLTRGSLAFDVADGCSLELGVVLYGVTDLPQFGGLDDRDRILLGFKYYF